MAEGRIDIALTVERERIDEVAIENRRPLGLVSHLAGLAPADALRRVVTLFSLCRIAQGLAGSMAVEQALGIDPGPSHKAARALLLRGETVLEHATCALLTRSALVAQRSAEFSVVKTLRTTLLELCRSVYPDGDWMQPGGGRRAPDKMALTASLDAAEALVREAGRALPLDIAGFRDWFSGASGPASGLLRLLEAKQWAGCRREPSAAIG